MIFKCEYCDKIFSGYRALGGHKSKSHPNRSESYRRKIEVRNKNTDRRELYNKAKKHFLAGKPADYKYSAADRKEILKISENLKT
jgi:hypothetical protein